MKIMVNEMQKKLSDHNTFDDVVKIYDSVSNFDSDSNIIIFKRK